MEDLAPEASEGSTHPDPKKGGGGGGGANLRSLQKQKIIKYVLDQRSTANTKICDSLHVAFRIFTNIIIWAT